MLMKPEKDLRASNQRWWLMVLLVTGMMICYAHRGALGVAAPFMIKELNLSREAYAELRSSYDRGVAEFLDLPYVKPNTLGNTRMLKIL